MSSTHRVRTEWRNQTGTFTYESYDRNHQWVFEGGQTLTASAAPEFRGDAALPNPEEALVGALSSCHMLSFLAIAARKRFIVESYLDHAEGIMEKNTQGRLAITTVWLRPEIHFGGERAPDEESIAAMHQRAHQECFIANSVHTEVRIESPLEAVAKTG